MNEDQFINLPFRPDYILAVSMKNCSLCEEKLNLDPDFDNSECIHCENKTMEWGERPSIQTKIYGEK